MLAFVVKLFVVFLLKASWLKYLIYSSHSPSVKLYFGPHFVSLWYNSFLMFLLSDVACQLGFPHSCPLLLLDSHLCVWLLIPVWN